MGDASSLVCMVRNCRKEVTECFANEQCKTALDELGKCGLNDQVRPGSHGCMLLPHGAMI
jgi:hypothetical protein